MKVSKDRSANLSTEVGYGCHAIVAIAENVLAAALQFGCIRRTSAHASCHQARPQYASCAAIAWECSKQDLDSRRFDVQLKLWETTLDCRGSMNTTWL